MISDKDIKVTDERATSGITDEDIKIKTIKASERTRTHLNSPGTTNRTFDSMEAMVENAESKYKKSFIDEMEKDKEKGFDINDINSINAFEFDYCPLQYTVVVKFIREEQKVGSIIIPDSSSLTFKGVVIEPGLMVNNLKRGDIVTFKPTLVDPKKQLFNPIPDNMEIIIKGIVFKEVSYESIAGVYLKREKLIERIAEENKKLKTD